MAYHFDGKAIFSTRNGEYARRERIPTMRTILRSNPIEDRQTMVARLQEEFPDLCKAIISPVTDRDVYEYFDYCDAAVHGFEFLRAILEYIAGLNASANAVRTTKVNDYVGRWRNTNDGILACVRPDHAVTDLFTEEDMEEHGSEFLTEALMHIKCLRAQEGDNEARQSALHLQMQHAHMMHDQRNFTQSQVPTRPPFPVSVSSTKGVRASSNPQHGQPRPQGGPMRHLPGPPGQFPSAQAYLPLQRLTSSTEVLEHIHSGSTSRGDFHSDPTAQNALDTYHSIHANDFVAIPSRGLPGPFRYQSHRPPIQAVPLTNRMGTFNGKPPKGKKNPAKKSTDDARIMPSTGNGSCWPSNDGNPKQIPPSRDIPVQLYPESPAMAQVRPPLGYVPYVGNYHQDNLPPGPPSGNELELFHRPPYHGQTPAQSKMGARFFERAATNPFLPSGLETQGSTRDSRPIVPSLPMSTNLQHQIAPMNEQVSKENARLSSTEVRPHISQQLDPHAFGRHLPNGRTDAQHQQDHIRDFQPPALTPMSNAGQPGTPGHFRANEDPRRPVQECCTIWIGGLPNNFDKPATLDMLRPCRGLVDVSEPRKSSPSKPRSLHVHSYTFAEFQNPLDAAEALTRLPQTRFASLPEGSFLSTSYPRPKIHPSPRHHQQGSDGLSKRSVSIVSPTKSRKGDESNRAGKSTIDHGRKPSRGRGQKEPTANLQGKPGRPSESVNAVDADQKQSSLPPKEAIASPNPDGKAESTVHVTQNSKHDHGSTPTSQDPGVIQPDVAAETPANQISRVTGDGAQDISSSSSSKLQVHESQQATSSKRTEGRTKPNRKKSKGSNKLSVPEKKESESSAILTTSGNVKPKDPAKPSRSESCKVLEGSGKVKEMGKAAFEIEAGKIITPSTPAESTLALPKDSNTADQSFLGCDPTGDDSEQPNPPVAHVITANGADDDKTEVVDQSKYLTSQAMERDESNSTQGSANTALSILDHTAPSSSSQTERTNSMSQEKLSSVAQAACSSSKTTMSPLLFGLGQPRDKLEASNVTSGAPQSENASIAKEAFEDGEPSQEAKADEEISVPNAEPGATAMEQNSEAPTSQTGFEDKKDTKHVQEELQIPTGSKIEGFQPGLIKEHPDQTPSVLLPSPSKSDQCSLRSPARIRALSIPPRSSSLATPLIPIKTHQKKKPRKFTPVEEASPSRVTGLSIKDTKIESDPQTTENTKRDLPGLTIDPTAPARPNDISKGLIVPETPFLTDDGMVVTPPKISRQTMEASNADQYYAQKKDYKALHWPKATLVHATFCSLDPSDSASTQPSETSTSDNDPAKKKDELEATLREAGYRSLSGPSPFTTKDPGLAFLETIDQEGNALDNRTNRDGRASSLVDTKGKLGPIEHCNAWIAQQDMIEIVKKATAVKRLKAGSSPLQFTTNSSSKPFAGNPGNISRTQQQEPRHPELINQLNLQTLASRLRPGEDPSQIANTDLGISLTSEQTMDSETSPSTCGRRTPPTERSSPSAAFRPSAAIIRVSKLKDIFVEMREEHQRRTEDRHSVNTPQEERTAVPDPELKPLSGESDVPRVPDANVVVPEQENKETKNEVQQDPPEDEKNVEEEKELVSEKGKQDRILTGESDRLRDPPSADPPEITFRVGSLKVECFRIESPGIGATQDTEDPAHQEQTSQLPGVSSSSFGSNHTTSDEGTSDEAQLNRLRGGYSPLKRSSYNAVASRAPDEKRGGKREARNDPWALPQGEKPWGNEVKGRAGRKKREGQ